MTLLSVLDILLMIVGGAGMIYQGLCIVMSLFAKPVRFPDAPMTNRYACLLYTSTHGVDKRGEGGVGTLCAKSQCGGCHIVYGGIVLVAGANTC